MERLLAEAEAIVAEAKAAGVQVALLGGLAVRAWAGPPGRETFDIDLVVSSADQVGRLAEVLRRRGYRVLDDPWWRRAVRGQDEERVIVDFTGPEVVDPKTLERYRLAESRAQRSLGTRSVPVIDIGDLLVLKLLAGRDQDVADLLLLTGTAAPASLATDVVGRAKAQGKLDAIVEHAARLRFGAHTGAVAGTVQRLIDREPSDEERQRFEEFLDTIAEAAG